VSSSKKYIFTSLIGNGLEWYDFAIFGYFAPIFSKLFFPSSSHFLSLINTFAVFAIGFISRPIGAYIFGKMGDQRGRKQALLYSMLLMAFSTALMGILPTYESIGILAPLALVILRIFQGISLGGEFTGSLSFVIEHAPSSKKGLIGAIAYSGGFLGAILGATIGTGVTSIFSTEEVLAFAWRIPFLLGFIIAFLSYYLRQQMEETPEFLRLKKEDGIEINLLKSIGKERLTDSLRVICFLLPNTMWVYFFVFLSSYLIEIKNWDFSFSFIINIVPSALAFIFIPISGYLSDNFGRKKIMLIGQIGLLALSPIVFKIFSEGNLKSIIAIQTITSIFFSLSCGPMAAVLTEMFPARLRNTGMAFSYHVATGIFGGLTPLLLTSFTSLLGMDLGPMIMSSCVSLIGLFALIGFDQSIKTIEVTK